MGCLCDRDFLICAFLITYITLYNLTSLSLSKVVSYCHTAHVFTKIFSKYEETKNKKVTKYSSSLNRKSQVNTYKSNYLFLACSLVSKIFSLGSLYVCMMIVCRSE